jgi:hypothetical protein
VLGGEKNAQASAHSSAIAWREKDVTVRLDADPDTISQDWPLRRR